MRKSSLKILHYLPGLPPVMGGGMIKYALDLAHGEIQAGHEALMLVPGQFTLFNRSKTAIEKKKWEGIDCYKIINPLPVSGGKGTKDISELVKWGNREIYTGFLKKAKPDVIHIHSFMGLHAAFLDAAVQLKIPVVYTTHDYYGICPNTILLNGMAQCMVTDGSKCNLCINSTVSAKRLRWRHSIIYGLLKRNCIVNFLEYSQKLVPIKIYIRSLCKNNKAKPAASENDTPTIRKEREYKMLRNYYREMFGYVTKFHFNSSQSKEVFTHHLGDISGDVILISNKNISDRRRMRDFDGTLRIGFIGRGEHKGFNMLKDALDNIYSKGLKDLELHVYFNPKEKLPPYIISHAPFDEKSSGQVYNGIDVLVLPSIWKETYGLVVSEALNYGVPVIVSQNVGAKELLKEHDGIGMIIEPDRDALQEALESVYSDRNLLKQMNLAICNSKMGLNFGGHVGKIINMYNYVKDSQ